MWNEVNFSNRTSLYGATAVTRLSYRVSKEHTKLCTIEFSSIIAAFSDVYIWEPEMRHVTNWFKSVRRKIGCLSYLNVLECAKCLKNQLVVRFCLQIVYKIYLLFNLTIEKTKIRYKFAICRIYCWKKNYIVSEKLIANERFAQAALFWCRPREKELRFTFRSALKIQSKYRGSLMG